MKNGTVQTAANYCVCEGTSLSDVTDIDYCKSQDHRVGQCGDNLTSLTLNGKKSSTSYFFNVVAKMPSEAEDFFFEGIEVETPGIVFSVRDLPTYISQNTTYDLTIDVKDTNGHTVEEYLGTLSISTGDALATVPLSATFQVSDKGSITLPQAVTFRTLGSHSFVLNDASDTNAAIYTSNIIVFDQHPFMLGKYHACAIKNGVTKCWGRSYRGQLGNGVPDDTQHIGLNPADIGNIPVVDLGTKAVSVWIGNYHSCILTEELDVKCWGNNLSGQLGHGDTDNKGDEPNEMGDQLPFTKLGNGRKAVQLSLGANQTCEVIL